MITLYISTFRYGCTPPQCRTAKDRHERLLTELEELDADVFCLQVFQHRICSSNDISLRGIHYPVYSACYHCLLPPIIHKSIWHFLPNHLVISQPYKLYQPYKTYLPYEHYQSYELYNSRISNMMRCHLHLTHGSISCGI